MIKNQHQLTEEQNNEI